MYKHSIILVVIPIITVVITFILVRNLPGAYISKAQISTGLINKSDDALLTGQTPAALSEIEQGFSNMIQIVQMQQVLDMVSYKLILHDLESKNPYRKPSKHLNELSAEEKRKAYTAFRTHYQNMQPLTLATPEEDKLNDILTSLDYDAESLKEKLRVYRVGQSDFITVEFESENPQLSAFVANSASEEFIKYYSANTKAQDQKSATFLSDLLKEKQRNLDEKMALLKSYKIKNGVLNLPEQARILYGKMVETQSSREEAAKQIIAYAGAINEINSKFSPRERKYLEATATRVNSDIVAYRERLQAMNLEYIKEGFDSGYKESMDSIQAALGSKIVQSVEENIYNPLSAKQDLVSQKITLQTQLDIAKHSVGSLEKEFNSLSSQFSRLVPFEASIQNYERDIETASQEYLEILDKYNQSNIQSNFSVKLRQSQIAMPGTPQASKKMLLVILSGVIGFAFVVAVLFALFFLDNTIAHPKELANATRFPVLGYIEKLSSPTNDILSLWQMDKISGFKDQLRALRFEVSNEMDSSRLISISGPETAGSLQETEAASQATANKLLSVTSFNPGEGKTLLSVSLAYALALTNKNVLLIDGNFTDPSLSRSIKAERHFEDYLLGHTAIADFSKPGISVLGNKGIGTSLLEVTGQRSLEEKFSQLRSNFDYIIVETPSLKDLDKAKEWFLFTDKIIGIFEANRKLNDQQKAQTEYLHALNHKKFIGWVINKVPVEAPAKKRWFKKNNNGSHS
ncbi:GumC family protein [Desertivirga xinjiangensis]|uniref:GumC family protein n=1 Tax=Desertivirga xinjiangensis TaxID=539206 RepID=UPI00210E8782|nr:lipopolysaccharide biosynthesis protein [Pedobacter xinjiangensis]